MSDFKLGNLVRFAHEQNGGLVHRVVSVMDDGMIEINDMGGYFAPHLFVVADDVADIPRSQSASSDTAKDQFLTRMLRQAFTRGFQAARSGKGHKAEMQTVVDGLLRYYNSYPAPILASESAPTTDAAALAEARTQDVAEIARLKDLVRKQVAHIAELEAGLTEISQCSSDGPNFVRFRAIAMRALNRATTQADGGEGG